MSKNIPNGVLAFGNVSNCDLARFKWGAPSLTKMFSVSADVGWRPIAKGRQEAG